MAIRISVLTFLAAIGLVLCGTVRCLADDTQQAAVIEATQLLLRGRYAEANEQFRQAKDDPAATVGLARSLLARGQTDEAAELLKTAAAQHKDTAALHAELALVALETGDRKLAEESALAALKLDANSLPARWVTAELLRTSGKLSEAEKAYGWFIDRQRQMVGSGKKLDAESALWIGQAAAEHARWTRNSRLFHSLVNDLYPAALKAEPNFWPAHLQSALLFHEKYNEPDALAAITAGLAINPNAADLHAARAAMAVRTFDVATAQASLDRALEINPRHVWALQLQADVQMINTNSAEALTTLAKALEYRPGDERTLGRMLGCHAAMEGGTADQPSESMRAIIASAEKQNPHCGELFLAAGDALDQMRRYGQAAGFYREALERMPQLSSARSQLGMTLMRLGDEKEASEVLEEAFKADPFHVRVKNTLEVLDLLQGYAVIETDHFVIKFDRGQDELLARYAARHLEEEVYPHVVKTLGYEPKDKTLFEIFSRAKNTSGHGWFSARMAGVPAIGTVGACAGKMVAIATPRELRSKYNWAKVLGHEFVHVVNLQQTDFNIPNWLTEGIAVHLENEPRPAEWNDLLAKRWKEETLFDLDNILFGFVRPQQRDDWTLAYCQAELYIDYAREQHGDDAIARLLAAYSERLTTADAIQKAFGISQEQFEQGYREFIAETVKQIATETPAKALRVDEALAAANKNPDDANAAARVAEAYWGEKKGPKAREWANKALKLEPKNALAHYVLARIQLAIGDTEAAEKLLVEGLNEETPHEPSLDLLANIQFSRSDLAAAEKYLTLGRQKFPQSERWTKGLARVYLTRGDDDRLPPILVSLAERDTANVNLRKKLAELALDRSDFEEARRWAREVMFLDLDDAHAHATLGQALAGLKRYPEAAEEWAVAVQLDGKNDEWKVRLGEALLKSGKKDEARRILEPLRGQAESIEGLERLLEEAGQE